MQGSLQEKFQHLKIRLKDVKVATKDFNEDNVIGEGGYGKVYKGELSHSKGQHKVAFKCLDRANFQGDPEFLKEIVTLSSYKHENLISLLGYCDEDGEKILVYEHASRGSLEKHLDSPTLTWMERLKICLDVAKGLCYLHDPMGTQEIILHRDMKSANILLFENWKAKVSDLGLSKIAPARHSILATNVVGTDGYMDPEYIRTSILTKESDVYSFGVVLFEVFCGEPCSRPINGHSKILVPMWKQSYEDNKLDEIIFEDLKDMDECSKYVFADIAYQCLHESRQHRPDMYRVVVNLHIALCFQEISENLSTSAGPPMVSKLKQELTMLLSKGILIGKRNMLFGDVFSWKRPITTGLIHILFILLVFWPELIMLTVFFFIYLTMVFEFFNRPRYQPLTDNMLLNIRQDRLRRLVKKIQNLVGDLEMQLDRMDSLLRWRDPQETAFFFIFCTLAFILWVLIPFRAFVLVTGFYIMRHPIFRNRIPSMPFNFYRMKEA